MHGRASGRSNALGHALKKSKKILTPRAVILGALIATPEARNQLSAGSTGVLRRGRPWQVFGRFLEECYAAIIAAEEISLTVVFGARSRILDPHANTGEIVVVTTDVAGGGVSVQLRLRLRSAGATQQPNPTHDVE